MISLSMAALSPFVTDNLKNTFSIPYKICSKKLLVCPCKLPHLKTSDSNLLEMMDGMMVSVVTTSLSSSSMVRTVYSVYRGAIRILRELLPVVEMDSGKSSSSLIDLNSEKSLFYCEKA